MPNGNFAVLDFDENLNEYFKPLQDFSEYQKWSDEEKSLIRNNTYCSRCKYLGSCLSEHLQPVKTLEFSCNGFRGLLDKYQHEIL
jgi:hypothetical protein